MQHHIQLEFVLIFVVVKVLHLLAFQYKCILQTTNIQVSAKSTLRTLDERNNVRFSEFECNQTQPWGVNQVLRILRVPPRDRKALAFALHCKVYVPLVNETG